MTSNSHDEQLAARYGGKRWIIATDIASAATPTVEELRRWGADVVAVVSAAAGIGDLPHSVPLIYTGTSGSTLMEGVRNYEASLISPSCETVNVIDRLDPDRTASVTGTSFLASKTILGRPVYGYRKAEWAALEDKTIVGDLWEAAGVDAARADVVPVADAAAVAQSLASELGSVWVADNTEGWHGGGEYTRWIHTDEQAAEATRWFSSRAKLVRVMPFLDGIPCSIHGFVSKEETAALRPVEMVILRQPESLEFRDAGFSTYWDPPVDHRNEMREAALRIGRLLRAEFDYRGGFSIDGVMTVDGFRPTELNPRLSGGLSLQARLAGTIPLGAIVRAMAEGDLDYPAQELEADVLPLADNQRTTRQFVKVGVDRDPQRFCFSWKDEQLRDAEEADATFVVEVGEGPSGSAMKIHTVPDRFPVGRSIAPATSAVLQRTSELLGLGWPRYEPAPDLRA